MLGLLQLAIIIGCTNTKIFGVTTLSLHMHDIKLEYIIGKRESILLHYGTVLQPFPGFTCLRSHSLLFVGMLASLCDIYTTTTVTTAGIRCTGTNCETTLFVNIITKVMNPVKCCNTVP